MLLAESLKGLEPGSVLRLNHPASAPLDVTLDNKVFAHASPGTHRRKLAALIVATPEKETR
jgi:flagellar motor switch protein FliM